MSSVTIKYRQGYIHVSDLLEGREIVRVSVDEYAYAVEVNSVQTAKLRITAHMKKQARAQFDRFDSNGTFGV